MGHPPLMYRAAGPIADEPVAGLDVRPVVDDATAQDWERTLVEAVRSLPEREARIIEMRHGLDGGETRTLREVSEELGISQERARQVEIKALRTIRTGRYASTLRRALSEAV